MQESSTLGLTPNRVSGAIARLRARIEHLDPDKVASVDEMSAVMFLEHAQYQNQQASAFAGGRLTFDEAQIIYHALGEVHNERNGGWAAGVDTATKVIVTQIIGELLGVEVGA